jgi:hypothetical protein
MYLAVVIALCSSHASGPALFSCACARVQDEPSSCTQPERNTCPPMIPAMPRQRGYSTSAMPACDKLARLCSVMATSSFWPPSI